MARPRRTNRRLAGLAAASAGLLATSLAVPSSASAADELPEQWRSYWVDAFNRGIYGPQEVDELVDEALAANANALIVQTARRYDCFCNRATRGPTPPSTRCHTTRSRR